MVQWWAFARRQLGTGPAWCLAWLVINISVSLLNKRVFQFHKFDYPLTVTICHLSTTSLLSRLMIATGGAPPAKFTMTQFRGVFAVSVIFWVNIVFGNWSVQVVTLALSQTVRSAIPGTTMLLSWLVVGKRYSNNSIAAVAVVVLGLMLTTWSQVDLRFSDLAILVGGCFLSSAKVVLTGVLMGDSMKVHPITLLAWFSPLAVVQMCIWGLWSGEFAAIYTDRDRLLVSGTAVNLATTSVLSFLLNVANFMTTKTTSALTLTVAGNVKGVLTIILSVVMFKTHIAFFNACGIFITLAGAAWYSWLAHLEKQQKRIADMGEDPQRQMDGGPAPHGSGKHGVQEGP